MDDNKRKALDAALAQIDKQYGKGSVMRMDDTSVVEDIQSVSTGSLGLDIALGIGGLPRGRVIEIYGPESSGKTSLTLSVIAQMQKAGGTAAFIDAEHALDIQYAAKLGVNIEELLVSQPDTGEQALEIADMLVRSGSVDIVVVDSVAALTPRAEIEGDMGDSHMGLQARLMSQALRKLTSNIKKTNTMVIFINQLRMKIGVMFGNPETTTGGNALKFYASVRLDIRRIGAIKKDDEIIGAETRVKVVKNKVAPPFRKAEFDMLYGEGISLEGEIIDQAVKLNIIEKSGSWYSYNGEKIGQGKDNVREFLKSNPEISKDIGNQVRDILDIQDLCELIKEQILKISKINNQTFNVGGGIRNSLSLRELTSLSEKVTKNSLNIGKSLNTSIYDIRYYVTNNKKVYSKYKWRVKKSIKDILKETLHTLNKNKSYLSKIL